MEQNKISDTVQRNLRKEDADETIRRSLEAFARRNRMIEEQRNNQDMQMIQNTVEEQFYVDIEPKKLNGARVYCKV